MLWLIYNLLFGGVFLLLLPKFFWRMRRRGGYARDFAQRIGVYRPAVRDRLAAGGWVWIHAVSVGELFVGLKVLEELKRRHPEARFLVSTTTSTGHAIARERVRAPDAMIYFPVDFPPVVRRVLRLVRPKALIVVESELWPNLVRGASRRGIPVFLVNGRISAKSFRGYRVLRVFTRRILRLFEILCVQSPADRDRLIDLLAPPDRIRVMNSAKYEVAEKDPAGEAAAAAALARVGFDGGRPVLLGGSTWPGEEGALLDVFRALRGRYPDLRLVLVPRHVERKADVIAAVEARGLRYRLRSDPAEAAPPPDVLVVDTTGELRNFYARATVIFVGKSLCSTGGQNIIEPALYAKPVVVGPHMENFPVVIDDFLAADAIRQAPDAAGLQAAIAGFLADPGLRERVGANAAALVEAKSGAIRQTVDLLEPRIFP